MPIKGEIMEDNEGSSDYERKSLRNVARVISTVLAGIILLFVVGYWIEDISVGRFAERWTLESTGMAVYALLIVLGSGLGWWREVIGGAILTITGFGMIVILFLTMGRHDYWVSLIFGFPFLLSGILYLIYWKSSQARQKH
jgi:hypothetical protein